MTKKEMTFQEKLAYVQENIHVPKGQYNSFGKYKYRKAEDILEACKGILPDLGLTVSLDDDIVMIGTRYYVKAVAEVTDGTTSRSTKAFAREPEEKKGMDEAQVTGSASSYARKTALSGLLGLDDEDDADDKDKKKQKETEQRLAEKGVATENIAEINKLLTLVKTDMAILTQGATVAQKGQAMMDLLGVTKFDDLAKKPLDQIKAIQKKVSETLIEKRERAAQELQANKTTGRK